jgi:uncharacterized protein (TIGR00730 family)
MEHMSKQVSVFGSGSPTPGQPIYRLARRLGQLLAEAGYTVVTGGYSGTMEAASRGAAEAGGHVIGVTCGQLEQQFGVRPNRWVQEIIHYEGMRDRLFHLVTQTDAAIALPGGVGTLSEVALTWSLLQTGELAPRPFILLGAIWQRTLTTFYDSGDHITPQVMELWQVFETPEEALIALQNWEELQS